MSFGYGCINVIFNLLNLFFQFFYGIRNIYNFNQICGFF